MANLIPVSRFDDVIALEKGNPIIGARLGMSNRQAQQLLNRLTFISNKLTDDITSIHDSSEQDIDGLFETEESLENRMSSIETKSDVVNVVASYTDIVNYDTTSLNPNDIVKCLNDQTHSNISTYYRWINNSFVYIGSERNSVPISVLVSKTVSPVRNVTYVLSGSDITLTLSNGSYTGLTVCVGSMSTGVSHIITGTDDIVIGENRWVRLTWNGTKWCVGIPLSSFDDTYPVGTVIMSTVNFVSSLYGVWSQVSTGSILITAGQSYSAGVVYGSDNQNYTATGTVGSTTLTAAQCPAHYHTANNSAVTITVAAGSTGSHTHSANKAWGDGAKYSSSDDADDSTYGIETTRTLYSSSHTHSASSGSVSSVGSGGAHSHTFSGTSVSVSVVQPYYNIFVFRRIG